MAKIELIARGLARRDNDVLLCLNLKGGYAYLPGGHVEFGESAREALEREFVEESGIQVTSGGSPSFPRADSIRMASGGTS